MTPEIGQRRAMLVVERIVQTGEVLAADGDCDACRAGRFGCQLIEMCEAPGARCEQTVVTPPHRGAVSGASSGPNREDKRFTSPALPFVAEVITVRIGTGRGEHKRRIADLEDGLVLQRRQGCESPRLCACHRKL